MYFERKDDTKPFTDKEREQWNEREKAKQKAQQQQSK
jgi:hypothetical protein